MLVPEAEMRESSENEITRLLREWNEGSESARDELIPLVYSELKRQADVLMSRERGEHTLQPTALVHEAFIKLGINPEIEWNNRRHFYGIVSRLMRQILIDHARKHSSAKRGGQSIQFSIDDLNFPIEERSSRLIDLNEQLDRLAKLDPRQAEIVELRFFGGLDTKEIASMLGMSERTVAREWHSARLWLYRELGLSDETK